MSLSVETLAVARKYTDDSLAGAGAVAGVPCKIQSITAITGGNRVTFLWTDNNGDDHTSAMDVMNGVDGEDGKGIQSVSVNAQNHLIITYTDGTTVDAGQIEIHSSVDSVNGQTGAVVLDAEDIGALPDNTPIPSKTSDLTNDSGFATTSDVSTALANYTPTADLTTLLAAKQDTLTFDNAPTENSNNPVKSGGVYAVNETLTNQANDMVNVLGAKNLMPYPYYRPSGYTSGNMTGTYDANGVITINKTADTTTRYFALYNGEPFLLPNTTYTLSLELTNATNTSVYVAIGTDGVDMAAIRNKATGKYDVTFTTPSTFDDNLIIGLYYGKDIVETNAIVKVMLRLASIQDDTWQPYAKTNKELTDDVASTMRVVNVSDVSIFDIISDLNSYPAKTEYYGYTASITNGSSTLGSLLNTGDYGVVSIKKYSEWHITISIISGNSNGKTHMACTNKNNTSIKFVNNDPAASIDKVTSTTISKAT